MEGPCVILLVNASKLGSPMRVAAGRTRSGSLASSEHLALALPFPSWVDARAFLLIHERRRPFKYHRLIAPLGPGLPAFPPVMADPANRLELIRSASPAALALPPDVLEEVDPAVYPTIGSLETAEDAGELPGSMYHRRILSAAVETAIQSAWQPRRIGDVELRAFIDRRTKRAAT